MQTVFLYILYYFFYSAAGWAFESTYCSIGERKLINRGFLLGPMCPIYGAGTLVMEVLLYNPFRDKPLLVFLLGMIFCDGVEYMTSFIMEKMFNTRWWNYENELWNIKGRICFKHTIFWGIGATVFVKYIHPRVEAMFARIPEKTVRIVVISILCVFVCDVIFAAIRASDMFKLVGKFNDIVDFISYGSYELSQSAQTKYKNLKSRVIIRYRFFKGSVSDKLDEFSASWNESNDKINEARIEVILEAEKRIKKFEEKIKGLGFSKKLFPLTDSKDCEEKETKKKLSTKAITNQLKDLFDDIRKK